MTSIKQLVWVNNTNIPNQLILNIIKIVHNQRIKFENIINAVVTKECSIANILKSNKLLILLKQCAGYIGQHCSLFTSGHLTFLSNYKHYSSRAYYCSMFSISAFCTLCYDNLVRNFAGKHTTLFKPFLQT